MATNNNVNTPLAGQTGTGAFVGDVAPTFVTPNVGVATATSLDLGGGALSSYIPTTAWTPTITFVVPGDLSVVYGVQSGTYTRVGNLVFVTIDLEFTPTYTTASGNFRIGGFPINPGYSEGLQIINHSSNITYPAGRTYVMLVTATTQVIMRGIGTAVANSAFSVTQFTTGNTYSLRVSGTYFA